MTFEYDYKNLLRFADSVLREYGVFHSDAAELVNEAYIKWFEGFVNKPYNIKDIKTLIRSNGWKQRAIENNNTDNTFHGEYACKRCQESLPANAFGIIHDKINDIRNIRTYCLKCSSELKCIWQKENKERWNAYVKGWRVTHNGTLTRTDWLAKKSSERSEDHLQGLWRKANRKYQNKQKEQLTDSYIKTILTNATTRRCDITSEMIQNKRTQLIQKREHSTEKNCS